MNERIVFMGSPEFALPTLQRLAQAFRVVGVVTQPDRPAGRGRQLTPPPVKRLALALGLPVIQPNRLRSEPEALAQLAAWAPDLIVVAAFGQILRSNVLEMPRFGCVNVHASLLPRWRGAAPIQAAILHGDAQTGITIMRMDAGVDTGPMLSQRALEILPEDTAGTLSARLAELGADLLMGTLPGYLSGAIQPQEQDHTHATLAPLLKKEHGVLDFSQPAAVLARQVRAFQPWPGASLPWQGEPLKVLMAHATEEAAGDPGKFIVHLGQPAVIANPGILVLDVVQPPGKKPMPGKVFLQGGRTWAA